jgi:hypothetical protein
MTTFETLTIDEEEYDLTLRWESEHCQAGYGSDAKKWTEWHCVEVESEFGTYALSDPPAQKWEHLFLEKYESEEYQPE